jgi:hypothetical protein
MFRTIKLTAAVLVAAAATASGALAQGKPVDPLAVSVLKGRGWSPSRIYDWTQGTCSYQVKPASCYLTPVEARLASHRLADSMGAPQRVASTKPAQSKPIDPLAVSVLRGLGWSASQVYDWTQGTCSYQDKPASCYLTPAEARLASERLAESMYGSTTIPATPTAAVAGGFNWGDAAIGAATTLGLVLILAGVGTLLVRSRRRHPVHA